MTIEQTVEVPASHRLTIDVPREVPTGPVVLSFTPARLPDATPEEAAEAGAALATGKPCPLCAKHTDPATGELRYNAETLAAIAEGDAMVRGEIPSVAFDSAEAFFAYLNAGDEDD